MSHKTDSDVSEESNEDRSVVAKKEFIKTLIKYVPSSFEVLNFSQLTNKGQYDSKVILAKIAFLYPVVNRKQGYLRKLLIIDVFDNKEDAKKLTLFLFDQHAQESKIAEIGSYIFVFDFYIESLTISCTVDLLPIQVLALANKAKLWFYRELSDKHMEYNQPINRCSSKDATLSPKNKNDSVCRRISQSKQISETNTQTKSYNLRTRNNSKTEKRHTLRTRISQQTYKEEDSKNGSTSEDDTSKSKISETSLHSENSDLNMVIKDFEIPDRDENEMDISDSESFTNMPEESIDVDFTLNQNISSPKQNNSNKLKASDLSTSEKYNYVSLANLNITNSKTKYHIYGVVSKFTSKSMEDTKKVCLDIMLNDESKMDFICSFIVGENEEFPIINVGDVVRIHRMSVVKYLRKLKGKCFSTRFLLVFSKSDIDNPRSVAKTFTFNSADRQRVKELFLWAEKQNQPKMISEIKQNEIVNIICQVIGVYLTRHNDAVWLKIWDGTRSNQFNPVHLGLKDEKIDQNLFSIARLYYVNLLVCDQHILQAGELLPKQYIEVRGVHLSKDPSLSAKLILNGVVRENCGIHILEDSDERVQKLNERLEKIIDDTQVFRSELDNEKITEIFLNDDISAFSTPISKENVEAEKKKHVIGNLDKPGCSKEPQYDVKQAVSDNDQSNKPGSSKKSQNFEEQIVDFSEPSSEIPAQDNNVVSSIHIHIKPKQNTHQELVDNLNKTPLEERNKINEYAEISSQAFPSTGFRSPINSTQEGWWNSIPTLSVPIGHSHIKPSSLSEVIKSTMPYKFRVFAMVKKFEPNTISIEKLIHLYCPSCNYLSEHHTIDNEPYEVIDDLPFFYCPNCSKINEECESNSVLEYTFLLVFDLHDGSGTPDLEVILWRNEADVFFKTTPEKALRNKNVADSIFAMLWKICPNSLGEDVENDAFLDCCILSYSINDYTRYQMFDTQLKYCIGSEI